MLLEGQHNAVGNDGRQDHVLEGSGGELRSREEVDDVPDPPLPTLRFSCSLAATTAFPAGTRKYAAQLSPPAAPGRRVKPTLVLFGNERGDKRTESPPQGLPHRRPAKPHRLLPDFMGL